jgi:hypothetical protein
VNRARCTLAAATIASLLFAGCGGEAFTVRDTTTTDAGDELPVDGAPPVDDGATLEDARDAALDAAALPDAFEGHDAGVDAHDAGHESGAPPDAASLDACSAVGTDGLGQPYSPGCGSTPADVAWGACYDWVGAEGAAATACSVLNTPSCGSTAIVCGRPGGQAGACACWGYMGEPTDVAPPGAGHVSESSSGCTCPGPSDPSYP